MTEGCAVRRGFGRRQLQLSGQHPRIIEEHLWSPDQPLDWLRAKNTAPTFQAPHKIDLLQRCDVAVYSLLAVYSLSIQAQLPTQVLQVQQLAGAGSQQSNELGDRIGLVNGPEVFNVALDNGLDACLVPLLSPARACVRNNLRETTRQGDVNYFPAVDDFTRLGEASLENIIQKSCLGLLQLGLGEREEPHNLRPAGQRVGQAGNRQDLGRAGQHKHTAQQFPGLAGPVHHHLYCSEQLRHPLHLVNDKTTLVLLKQTDGIILGKAEGHLVTKVEMAPGVIGHLAGQGGFAGLSWPGDDDDGSVLKRQLDLFFSETLDVFHGEGCVGLGALAGLDWAGLCRAGGFRFVSGLRLAE